MNTATKNKRLYFYLLILLLLVDRTISILHFGFEYTDIDQVLQWEGALDYAEGIFREPFFYGQDYNYMLESFLAVPLLWLKVPVYMALPIITCALSVFPFIVLAYFFFKRNHLSFAFLSLILPILLPLEFSFLTSMPRGFVQASVFMPLLYFAFFQPLKDRSATLYFIGSALCFMANPSSILLILPIGIYLFSFHIRSRSFYLKSLYVLPFLLLYWLSKHYYVIHPEKLLLHIEGIDLEIGSWLEMITRTYLFEYLFPFFSGLGFLYPIVFLFLAISLYRRKGFSNELLFVGFSFIVLMFSLSVPKVLYGEMSSGLFYTHSRLFIYLPLILLMCLYFTFNSKKDFTIKSKVVSFWSAVMIAVLVLFVVGKNWKIEEKVERLCEETSFPVEKISDLTVRVNYIDSIAKKHDVEVMVTQAVMGWNFAFESFAYQTLMETKFGKKPKMIAIQNVGDRRTWLYDKAEHCNRIMLYVCFIDEDLLKEFDAKQVGYGLVLIENNKLPMTTLFAKLNLPYGKKKQ